jgi:hypothetical protein
MLAFEARRAEILVLITDMGLTPVIQVQVVGTEQPVAAPVGAKTGRAQKCLSENVLRSWLRVNSVPAAAVTLWRLLHAHMRAALRELAAHCRFLAAGLKVPRFAKNETVPLKSAACAQFCGVS